MAKMIIAMIAAMDLNRAIGHNNTLMWHLPDDFKWFKDQTKGKPMIMGRNTMVSLGRALPGRLNIVVSSSSKDVIEGYVYADSLENAMLLVPEGTEELMILGGGVVFKEMLPKADRLYVTLINHIWPEADVFFPEWKDEEWHTIYNEHHATDERHAYSFDFKILEKK